MKLIITGGAGFIGSNFIYYELKHHPEDEFICLDKLTYAGNLSSLKDAMEQPNFKFVRGDIASRRCSSAMRRAVRPSSATTLARTIRTN